MFQTSNSGKFKYRGNKKAPVQVFEISAIWLWAGPTRSKNSSGPTWAENSPLKHPKLVTKPPKLLKCRWNQ